MTELQFIFNGAVITALFVLFVLFMNREGEAVKERWRKEDWEMLRERINSPIESDEERVMRLVKKVDDDYIVFIKTLRELNNIIYLTSLPKDFRKSKKVPKNSSRDKWKGLYK